LKRQLREIVTQPERAEPQFRPLRADEQLDADPTSPEPTEPKRPAREAADAFRRQYQPQTRVIRHEGGFALREKVTEGLPLFAREEGNLRQSSRQSGESLSDAEIRSIAEARTRAWENAPRLHFPANEPELQRDLNARVLNVEVPEGARGYYLNGEAWIVRNAHRTRVEVERTLAHEAVAHHSPEGILGLPALSH
jgi:hypothetical protein